MERIRDENLVLGPNSAEFDHDIVLDRCISHSRSLYVSRFLEERGVRVVNSHNVIATCGDKAMTTLALGKANLPTPRTLLTFSEGSALKALQVVGYPAVLKPVVGSWGRYVAKVDDEEQAMQMLEHKAGMGNYMHSIFYVQEYISKPGYDLRAHVVGDEVISAMIRRSASWITNAARGAICEPHVVTPEIQELSLKAAEAVGGGILGVDLLPAERGLLVNEINHTMEFKAATSVCGVDIAGKIIDFVLEEAAT